MSRNRKEKECRKKMNGRPAKWGKKGESKEDEDKKKGDGEG